MFFNASKLYCKYVIDSLCNYLKKIKPNSKLCEDLDDKIFETYLKLEEILKFETSNF